MLGDFSVKDPGNAGVVDTGKKGYAHVHVKTAGAETRVVSAPKRATQTLILSGDVLAGTATITINGGVSGLTSASLTTAGQVIVLTAVLVAGVPKWQFSDQATLATVLASTSNGAGASDVGYEDAANVTTAATVEAALAELHDQLLGVQHGYVFIPLGLWVEVDADGDVGNDAANGGVLSSQTTPIREGTGTTNADRLNFATGVVDRISGSAVLPPDFDGSKDVLLECVVASAGTTNGWDTAVLITNWNGGADVTDALADTAATATHLSTATIAAADVADTGYSVTVSITPPTHATDALYFFGARLRYTRKLI
jgi:hypothetical protein